MKYVLINRYNGHVAKPLPQYHVVVKKAGDSNAPKERFRELNGRLRINFANVSKWDLGVKQHLEIRVIRIVTRIFECKRRNYIIFKCKMQDSSLRPDVQWQSCEP